MAPIIPALIMALSAGAALQAQALQLLSLSPQGEVAQVRQVVAKFNEAAVNFGNPQAPPLALSCSDAQAAKGSGRWSSEREWIFEFEKDLPPGVRCAVNPVSGFKSPSSALFAGASSYEFHSVRPFIQNLHPSSDQPIDEEQYFVPQLSGPATRDSLRENVWCSVEGLGERVPMRRIESPERGALLKLQNHEKAAAQEPLRFAALKRRENRHQQGHARQLGHRFFAALHRWRVGGQCQRHQRRGAGLGCANEPLAPGRAKPPALAAAWRGARPRGVWRAA